MGLEKELRDEWWARNEVAFFTDINELLCREIMPILEKYAYGGVTDPQMITMLFTAMGISMAALFSKNSKDIEYSECATFLKKVLAVASELVATDAPPGLDLLSVTRRSS